MRNDIVIARLINRLSVIGMAALLVAIGYTAGTLGETGAITAQGVAIELTESEMQLAELYDRISPSIVSINIAERVGGAFEDISGGSGFVYDYEGHIVTNYHVINEVSDQGRIEVNFIDGTITRAEVIGEDADSDIAVIKVDVPQERLFPITFGDSDRLVIGQTTVALGSPFGQRWTMTTGIISALDRTIIGLSNRTIGAVIQTDAAINPGNSGGPLLNLRGEVLGVNSQIISEERINSGIAFAVPSNLVQRIVRDLIEDGRAEYSYMGIDGRDITLDIIENLNLPNNTRGVLLKEFGRTRTVSPAQQGGLQINDIIMAIDGEPITSFGTLIAYLATRTEPGQTVTVTVMRGDETRDFQVTLGQRR
jgi:S1-C subfamily serine protease